MARPLEAAAERVAGTGRIESLLEVAGEAGVDVGRLLEELAREMRATLVALPPIALAVEGGPTRLARERVMVVGLLFNELATNAPSTPSRRTGPAGSGRLAREDEDLVLGIEDDVVGMPADAVECLGSTLGQGLAASSTARPNAWPARAGSASRGGAASRRRAERATPGGSRVPRQRPSGIPVAPPRRALQDVGDQRRGRDQDGGGVARRVEPERRERRSDPDPRAGGGRPRGEQRQAGDDAERRRRVGRVEAEVGHGRPAGPQA